MQRDVPGEIEGSDGGGREALDASTQIEARDLLQRRRRSERRGVSDTFILRANFGQSHRQGMTCLKLLFKSDLLEVIVWA